MSHPFLVPSDPESRYSTSEDDLAVLRGVVGRIVGQRCSRVAFSYGEELRLELGERIPTVVGKAERKRGEWTLLTRGSPWQFMDRESHPPSRSHARSNAVLSLEGKRLNSLEVSPHLNLAMTFDARYVLTLNPERREPKQHGPRLLPYWELFTPEHQLIVAGPGDWWKVKPADSRSSTRDGAPALAASVDYVTEPSALPEDVQHFDRLQMQQWMDLIEDLLDEVRRLEATIHRRQIRSLGSRAQLLTTRWRRLLDQMQRRRSGE
jgi:hypothetical protein